MATITIEVPDAAVVAIAKMIRTRYPDLDGVDDLDVGRRGVGRIIRETFRTAEADRIERALQDQIAAQRAKQLGTVDALLGQIA